MEWTGTFAFPTVNELKHYPLKLSNNDNSCYANVTLQATIHFGHSFFNRAMIEYRSHEPNAHDFATIYYKYICDMVQGSNNSDSKTFRNYVARFPSDQNQHYFLNGTQQDAYEFNSAFIKNLPRELKELFIFKQVLSKKCNCGAQSTQTTQCRGIYLLLNTQQPITKFSESFDCFRNSQCETCQQFTRQCFIFEYIFPEQCQFVILYTQLFTQGETRSKIASKFSSYNIDHISFPEVNYTRPTIFKIISVVVRIGDRPTSGHYVIWCRNLTNETWVRISDTTHRTYNKLPKDLGSIQLFYLKRI